MNRTPLTVSICVGMRAGCTVDCRVLENGDVEFLVGGGGQEPAVITFDATMLREFLIEGNTALLRLDTGSQVRRAARSEGTDDGSGTHAMPPGESR